MTSHPKHCACRLCLGLPPMDIASFGGGVQSTTIALLALDSDPRLLAVSDGRVPEHYLFADTGDEPEAVYRHIDMMRRRFDVANVPFHVLHRYSGVSLSKHLLRRLRAGKESNLTWIPAYVEGATKSVPLQRRCTFRYKVEALDRAAKRLAQVPRLLGGAVYQGAPFVRSWIGISLDESQRMRAAKHRWSEMFYPLVEMGWRRSDCLRYLSERCVPAPRSACVYCPFHSDREWERMRVEAPADFRRAVLFERHLLAAVRGLGDGSALRSLPYLHPSRVPLDEVTFGAGQLDLWGNDCSGVCGV